MVSQPGTLSHIEMGWVYDRGQKRAVQVMIIFFYFKCIFKRFKYPRIATLSRGIWARAEETPRTTDSDSEPEVKKEKKKIIVKINKSSPGQWYDVQVSLRDNERGLAYFGHDWESRVIERFVK